MSLNKGMSLIELLIAIFITAMIAIPLINALRTFIGSWQAGSSELEANKNIHYFLSPLNEKLRFAKEIAVVSLSNNNNAFIQYKDITDKTTTIFYNSQANQQQFNAVNTFPENSLVIFIGLTAENIELLLQNIQFFTLETFEESTENYFKVSVPNNINPIKYEKISSIKVMLKVNVDGREELI